MKPRLLDLFGGEGLAALGYARAGFDVTSVEIDPERIANHVQHPDVTVVEGDATTYPLDSYDVVVGSPPCTDHTTRAALAERTRGSSTDTGWMLPHTITRFRDVRAGVERARRLMGAPPETSPRGLALGIPPAMTQCIGEQLMEHLTRGRELATVATASYREPGGTS